MLKNILTAVGFVRPEIGYCQGMNFIAGALANLIDNEEKCFWIFLTFIDNIQLNLLYLKNMPDFLIRVYQLKKFIEFYFPKLSNHLRRNQINIDLFFSKWLLTIFSNYFPFDVLYHVWDVFIIDKWKSLFRFCMIIIFYMKEDMMQMDLNKFSQYFKSNEVVTSFTFDQMIKHYNDYKITNKMLKELRQDFFVSQVEAKLNNPKVITLGAKTAGGPCAVRNYITTIGSAYASSSLYTISKEENGKYVNIDGGVNADFELTEDKMIDREYIKNNIKNWKK